MLTASTAVPKLGWHVFFEQPTAQALAPIRDQLVRIALLIALGLVVAIIAGTMLARRMLVPITALARRRPPPRRRRFRPPHRGEDRGRAGRTGQASSTAWPASWPKPIPASKSKVKERTRDLAQSINELKVLEEVGRAVASSLDLNAVLPTVAARALEITHADAVLIYGYDADQASVQPDGSDRHRQDRPKAAISRSTADGSPLGEAAAKGEPIAMADLDAAPDHPLARRRDRRRLPFGAGGAAGRPAGRARLAGGAAQDGRRILART